MASDDSLWKTHLTPTLVAAISALYCVGAQAGEPASDRVAVDDGATLTVAERLARGKQIRLRCKDRDEEEESVAARRDVCEVLNKRSDVAVAMIDDGLAWPESKGGAE